MPERNELTALQAENARLIALLEDHGIEYEHLAGKRTIGVYPLLADDTCHFGSGRRYAA